MTLDEFTEVEQLRRDLRASEELYRELTAACRSHEETEKRVREVLAWARARDEELLNLRDQRLRLSGTSRMAGELERAASELRDLADGLEGALTGGEPQ